MGTTLTYLFNKIYLTVFSANKWLQRSCMVLIITIGALPVLAGHVRYAGSDAKGVTVVAQQMLKTGNISLTGKQADYFRSKKGDVDHHTIYLNGRIEYFFPLGPVLLVMPFVAEGNLLGADFTARKADWKLQQKLVYGVAVVSLALLYAFSRSAFSRLGSLAAAYGFFYGSLLAPTISGAFWSIDSEIVITGLVILVVWEGQHPICRRLAVLIGVLLFLGFLCRPTFATFILPIFIYLAIKDRRALTYATLVSAAFFAMFVAFSEVHYNSYLPPYYLASRLSTERAWSALWGLLVSPSRGVLIFCPFLIILAFCAFLVEKRRNSSLLKILALSMLMQFLACIFFPKWWGGESFGPRTLANFSFLGCVVTIGVIGGLPCRINIQAKWSLAAALLVGIVVNLPGVLSDYTRLWNEFPDPGSDQRIVFDWRFPQFLTISKARLVEKCLVQSQISSLKEKPSCPNP